MTRAVVAASSTVFAIGAPPGADAWTIALDDPFEPGSGSVEVALSDRALATSGSSYRAAVASDGISRGPVLSPWTLQPIEGRYGSVVIAPTAARADALATAVCAGGEAVVDRLNRLDGVVAVLDGIGPERRATPRRYERTEGGFFIEGTDGTFRSRIHEHGHNRSAPYELAVLRRRCLVARHLGCGLPTLVARVGVQPRCACVPSGSRGRDARVGRAERCDALRWSSRRRLGGLDAPTAPQTSSFRGSTTDSRRVDRSACRRATGPAVAGRQVGPRVRIAPSGRILVSWVDRGRDPAGDIVLAYSDDDGETFRGPVRVSDGEESCGQEYHDLALLPDGEVVAVWLDERDAPDGQVGRKEVYAARSRDGGASFEASRRVTRTSSRVCPCCRPSLAVTKDGSLHVAFRLRVPDGLLVHVASSSGPADEFGSPVPVPVAAWAFDGCPVDGPVAQALPDGSLAVVWRDGRSGVNELWFSRRRSEFSVPRRVRDSVPPEGETVSSVSMDSARSDGRCCDRATGRPGGALRGAAFLSTLGTVDSDEPLEPGEAGAEARASVVADATLGFVAAWEDDRGRVWWRPLESDLDDRATLPPSLLADPGDEARAHSVALCSANGRTVALWVEERLSWSRGSLPKVSSRVRATELHASGEVQLAALQNLARQP